MKRILMLLTVAMLLLNVGGQAYAYFEDGHLIRVVYQLSGQYEVDTDLGPFNQTTPYSGNMSFTANPFPPAGNGAFSSATWDKLQVAYFIKDSNNMFAWTSGPATGQTNGSRQFGSFEGAADLIYAGANFFASGTAQAVVPQSNEQSYVTLMDTGNPADSAGYFAGFIPDQTGEQNLAALGAGSTYVDSYLYYYANPDNETSGLQIADIRTYADGHSAIVSAGNPVATHFSVSAPATAKSGVAFNVTVTALDASNNTVTGYAGTVHFTSTDAGAILPANTTLTNGAGTFSATLKTVGSQTITATDTVTASITGTSSAISVTSTNSTATHFKVSAPTSATAGTAFNFTVTALDASNKVVSGYTGTVHFTSTDSKATLPMNSTLTGGSGTFHAKLTTAGSRTITATDTVSSTVKGTSNAVSVNATAATHFTVSAPSSATAGASFTFTVTAMDQFNNKAIGYNGAVNFSSTDTKAVLPAASILTAGAKSFTATLKTAGSRTITATDTVSSTVKGTSNAVSVNATAATHFTVSAPASATAGKAFSFTVTALDQFNNKARGYTGTAHFTSTDSKAILPSNSTLAAGAGTFSATMKTTGSRTITAADTLAAAVKGTSVAISVK